MTYQINLNYQGDRENHITNPLNRLAGCEFATRDDACEAIFKALYDVIDGERGCEMVAKDRKAYWVLAGEGECGTWHRIVTTPRGIKRHLTQERCGGDRFARAVCDIYETQDGSIAGHDAEDGAPVDVTFDAEDDIGEALDVHEDYVNTCHTYIMREGYAREDGVTATVEEVA